MQGKKLLWIRKGDILICDSSYFIWNYYPMLLLLVCCVFSIESGAKSKICIGCVHIYHPLLLSELYIPKTINLWRY